MLDIFLFWCIVVPIGVILWGLTLALIFALGFALREYYGHYREVKNKHKRRNIND